MDSKIYLQSILADVKIYCPKVVSAPEKIEIDTKYEKIFKLASKFALGCKESDILPSEPAESKKLHSIFKHISLNKSKAAPTLANSAFGLKPLTINPATFYSSENEDNIKFWQEFKTSFQNANNPNASNKVNAENILTVLHKFAYCLPAPLQNPNGISLYDYIRIKAGLALCLTEQSSDKDQPLLLIGGAVSGIQDFIYNIISKSAAKNLKGRSFYLQLLIDGIKTYILDELQLMQGNVIYSSGGNFYIIAPNTDNIISKLKTLKKDIAENIFKKHNTQLFTTFEWVAISNEYIENRTISKCWDCLVQKINLAKSQKFSDVLDYDAFFEPFEVGGIATRDAITGEELSNKEHKSFLEKQADTKANTEPHLPLTGASHEQIELGKTLKKTDYIVCIPAKYGKEIYIQPSLSHLNIPSGYQYYLLKEDHLRKIPTHILKECIVTQLNKTDLPNKPVEFIQAFDFYGGNDYPTTDGDDSKPKDFSDFVSDKDFKRIAVLRMDVDNLGKIFREIFKDSGSFAEYAALSRSLDYFFKGYLNHLWETVQNEATPPQLIKNDSQIIYSGGDDLFIVGNWESMITLAEQIQQKFKEYVCGNPDFTISGGLALVTHKFPIMRAADMAGDAEKDAKKHLICIGNNQRVEKNAVSFLNYCFNWEHQFGDLKQMKAKIEQWLNKHKVPKSFFLNVASYYERHQDIEIQEKNALNTMHKGILKKKKQGEVFTEAQIQLLKQDIQNKYNSQRITLRFQLAYILAQARDRYFKQYGTEQRAWREFIQELQTKILLDYYHDNSNTILHVECFTTIYVAIQWAFLKNRLYKN